MIRALRAAVRVALAAGTCAAWTGCCVFGRSYGASNDIWIHRMTDGTSSPTKVGRDGTLDLDSCRALCPIGHTIQGCAFATMGDGGARQVECAYGTGDLRARTIEGLFDPKLCERYCGGSATTCRELPKLPPGERVVACLTYTPGGCDVSFGHGRATREARARRGGPLLARMAHAEAASVIAFGAMARELAALGAPRRLIEGARRCARDEARHAAAMMALGAQKPRVVARRVRSRSLYALARENLREGCVGETVGVAFLFYAAAHAPDARLRRTFARLANDELRHAAWSFAVHRWAVARLSPAARRRLARTVVRIPRGPTALGFPDDAASEAIVQSLVQSVFAG